MFKGYLAVFMALSFNTLATEPTPFLWGVSNSSFQVEGSPAPSDWSQWTHRPGRIFDGTNADIAAEFWHRYEEDIKLSAELGAKVFRMSIAWERIQTGPETWDLGALAHYEKIIDCIRKYKMEPMVTLHHWTLPLWLAEAGGLMHPDFPKFFVDYSRVVVDRLALSPLPANAPPETKATVRVKWWMTFNEPMVQLTAGYVDGQFPPGVHTSTDRKTQFRQLNRARRNMIAAHIETYKILKADYGDQILFSIAPHLRVFVPRNPNSFWDKQMAQFGQSHFNEEFIDALKTGKMRLSNPMEADLLNLSGLELSEDFAVPANGTLDYLGINYYGRKVIEAFKYRIIPFDVRAMEGGGAWRSDAAFSMGSWEIHPQELSNILRWAYERYGVPLFVSENGLADAKDKSRARFIREHAAQIKAAQEEGIPVLGYLYWSLTDNFEWSEGLRPRFGLVGIDYATQQRKIRPSYYYFQKLIRDNPGARITQLTPLPTDKAPSPLRRKDVAN